MVEQLDQFIREWMFRIFYLNTHITGNTIATNTKRVVKARDCMQPCMMYIPLGDDH
jgi:hypothetical protein